MIENFNQSKNSSAEFVDVRKFVGVASINILAINPNNAKLRSYGWTIPDDADEPKYVVVNEDGKKSARIRFLVQIQDLDDKPIVPMDFWIRPDLNLNQDGTKCKILDSFGRTAWATKSEVQSHSIPQYANGPANISSDYKPCHVGEDTLIQFLMKWLNMTPLDILRDGVWRKAEKPGKLTIDDWNALCNGNVAELAKIISYVPENRCKVVLGLRKTDENKSYQTFLPTCFLSNGTRKDLTGAYPKAAKEIEKYLENRESTNFEFSAFSVKEYKEEATEVNDSSSSGFPNSGAAVSEDDDLPFA